MPYGKREWGQEKILIVDDVETNRLVLEEIIHSMGCSPVLAERRWRWYPYPIRSLS